MLSGWPDSTKGADQKGQLAEKTRVPFKPVTTSTRRLGRSKR